MPLFLHCMRTAQLLCAFVFALQLICAFVFAYAKCRFSLDAACIFLAVNKNGAVYSVPIVRLICAVVVCIHVY